LERDTTLQVTRVEHTRGGRKKDRIGEYENICQPLNREGLARAQRKNGGLGKIRKRVPRIKKEREGRRHGPREGGNHRYPARAHRSTITKMKEGARRG